MKKLLISTVFLACLVPSTTTSATEETPPKNIIFLIGDGMGNSYTSAYRYYKNNSKTQFVTRTSFDSYLVGQQMTYSQDSKEKVTDSASAATAMATGVKTYNAAVGVDNDKTKRQTVLEAAKKKEKSTGIVVTSQLTHATPASYGGHDTSRKNMNAIANDFYDEKINGQHKIDVMLGGGKAQMIRTDRDLTKEFKKDGYNYVTSKEALEKNTNPQLLGLFAKEGLTKKIDRVTTPDLAVMTNAALKQLSKNEKGFFLLVEGSQIDWAGHDNDIVSAMSELADFEKAFEAAISFAKKDGETLVIATADHSTGGFSIAKAGNYNWYPSIIRSVQKTPDYMAKKIKSGSSPSSIMKKYMKFNLTAKEIQSVTAVRKKSVKTIDNALEKIINTRSNTGWTTSGHTGEDVNIYAYGPSASQFSGHLDNTDQAKKIFQLINGTVPKIIDK